MRKIVETDFYEMSSDDSKNRMYLTLKGFWKTPDHVPNYVVDIDKASASMKRDYTLVTDLTSLAAIPVSVNPVHEKAQEALMKNGLAKTAEIVENPVMKSVAGNIAKNTTMQKKEFATREEAERWLDSIS